MSATDDADGASVVWIDDVLGTDAGRRMTSRYTWNSPTPTAGSPKGTWRGSRRSLPEGEMAKSPHLRAQQVPA
jgi:hypothetical protein